MTHVSPDAVPLTKAKSSAGVGEVPGVRVTFVSVARSARSAVGGYGASAPWVQFGPATPI